MSWHRLLLLLEGVGPQHRRRDRPLAARRRRRARRRWRASRGRAYSTELRALAGLFRRLGDRRRRPDEQLGEVLRYYEPLLKRVHPDDYPKRAARPRALRHHRGALPARCESLLTDMALEPPSDSVGDVLAADEDEGLLSLSTIHSAKGLEWHTVFIIWAVDGKFPSAYSMHGDDELEEERRLMYVAVTRAKQQPLPQLPDQHVRPRPPAWCSRSRRASSTASRAQLLRPMQLVEAFD